jgi:hypothetical protein
MTKLSTEQRKHMKKSEFLGPGRTFPGNDRNHLEAAIRDAPKSEHAGNISHATEERIVHKAKERLGELSHRKRRIERKYGSSK